MHTPSSPRAIFHDISGGCWLHYTNPRHIVIATSIEEILPALDRIERIVDKEGFTAVGFVAYEAASAFDPALSVKADGGFPLLWFGLFPQPDKLGGLKARASPGRADPGWQLYMTQDEYRNKVGAIHEYIRGGDVYQVNFSYRMRTAVQVDPLDVFAGLMAGQETRQAAFIDTGEWAILSASPELFFRLEGDRIESRPMKGTSARGLWFEDDRRKAETLRTSEKERAENLMIVDMVRNDIGRIADVGSVTVPALFTLERYPTVWQMTSTVCGRTGASLREIFGALFPPASVTGAPKVRAMEIISESESSPRRIYTGTIGWIAPGRRAAFNVAIRTVLINHEDKRAEYGVGSGIVWDSKDDREWEECSIKAKVLHTRMPEFDLLETMLWSPDDGYSLLERHLRRLEESAIYFGFEMDAARMRDRLDRLTSELPPCAHKVRLLLSRAGNVDIETNPMVPDELKFGDITIAETPVDSSNVFLYHKTTNRKIYEEALKGCHRHGDVIIFNEKGEVTETTIANIAAKIGGKLCTPPVRCGLLAGTYRTWLVEQGKIRERPIKLGELRGSTEIYLMNSVRGIQKARLITQ